jgi:hypothetical protein
MGELLEMQSVRFLLGVLVALKPVLSMEPMETLLQQEELVLMVVSMVVPAEGAAVANHPAL